MSKQSGIPAYTRHKPKNLAYVRLNGRCVYLGRWNSPESRQAYDRVVAEWLARDRQEAPPPPTKTDGGLTIVELIAAYWPHAERHYRKPDGRPTGEIFPLREALKILRQLYGSLLAAEFGPLKLYQSPNSPARPSPLLRPLPIFHRMRAASNGRQVYFTAGRQRCTSQIITELLHSLNSSPKGP
jgi:hypothetical protein